MGGKSLRCNSKNNDIIIILRAQCRELKFLVLVGKCHKYIIRHIYTYSRVREIDAKTHASLPMPLPKCVLAWGGQTKSGSKWRKAGPWVDWAREEGGTGLGNLNWIQTLVPGQFGLTCGTRICVSDFAGTNPSRPIGVVAVWHRIRKNNSSYSGLHYIWPQLHASYRTGQLAWFFQHILGSGHLTV